MQSVESRIRPNGGFGKTPGKLVTLSKPNHYPKYVRTPAQKWRKILNPWNPVGRFDATRRQGGWALERRWRCRPRAAFTPYCYYQYGMVHSIQTGVRRGSRILPNNRAIVLHQAGQCRRVGGVKGWLICPQQPRSKTISCKGQALGRPSFTRLRWHHPCQSCVRCWRRGPRRGSRSSKLATQ